APVQWNQPARRWSTCVSKAPACAGDHLVPMPSVTSAPCSSANPLNGTTSGTASTIEKPPTIVTLTPACAVGRVDVPEVVSVVADAASVRADASCVGHGFASTDSSGSSSPRQQASLVC